MKKDDFVSLFASDRRISPAEAADELDRIFHRILKKLKRGQSAHLPGLGKLRPAGKSRLPAGGLQPRPGGRPRK